MERRNEETPVVRRKPSRGACLSAVGLRAHARRPRKLRNVTAMARNPLGMAIGSVAVGFLAGMLLPVTAVERERMGPSANA